MQHDWQRRQAAECGCHGGDDMCPCQNVDRAELARQQLEAAVLARHQARIAAAGRAWVAAEGVIARARAEQDLLEAVRSETVLAAPTDGGR